MSKTTACPLDCYDACEIVYENEQIRARKEFYTQGFLCPHLNHYNNYVQIKKARYQGKEISNKEAIDIVINMLQSSQKDEILHYKGSGSFGLMQDITEHFFSHYGATLIEGSLCDGAGAAGIIQGRGSNKNMPISQVKNSEVVIVWGRNLHTTSSHVLPLLKGKTIIVIDPVKTQIAQEADLHIQLKPHGDLTLAMLFNRFLYINDACDSEFLQKYASEYEEYYELTQTVRIKASLEAIDVTLGQIGKVIELVKDKRVAILCGVGIQKYSDGADIMRAIDAFAAYLGLFGKEGCGISYLGDSKALISSPFGISTKRVSKVNTEFSNYKTVFIQGANPLSQMPDSLRVTESISKVENVVYFGLHENETSQIADLVIPAKNFLAKGDIRTSYSHNAMIFMNQQIQSDSGFSEYELTQKLCDAFDIALEDELYYFNYFKQFAVENSDGALVVKGRDEIVYKNGFDTDDGEFAFLEEFENDFNMQESLFLITPKFHSSLNSQFKRNEFVYINTTLGYEDDEMVEILSSNGSVKLKVRNSDDVRADCVLIYSGTPGVNNLTSSKHSLDSKTAMYQENKVTIKKA